MFTQLEQCFRELAPAVAFCGLRLVRSRHEILSVRRDVVQPVHRNEDMGAMVTIVEGGVGYGATPDVSKAGLKQAIDEARAWARASAGRTLVNPEDLYYQPHHGDYQTPVRQPWNALSLEQKLALLRHECARLKVSDAILDWRAALRYGEMETLYLSADGGRVAQTFQTLLPMLHVAAHHQGETQSRSFGGDAYLRQGGLEILAETGFYAAAPRIAEQALTLLSAPNCPAESCDLLLAPDQMALQIHESIGHPLELDRILGDERNYAGTSFVTSDMFGRYRYGSELLNVTFDSQRPQQIASYAYDDEGQPATREYLIRGGILLRSLGSGISQRRAGLPGVANARACSWNRPPIDRMANLNVEPGAASFDELLRRVERGIYMETNCSWSIDDSRNKFQFGCEWGQRIENGELTQVVKNPNYRGVSAQFWRNLIGVGNPDSVQVMGVPHCGKGEPNQLIQVGHASPPCLFHNVAVFGGE